MPSSSTNPDGPSRRCPLCGYFVAAIPSTAGDATCPRCGSLLWFTTRPGPPIPQDLLSLGAKLAWSPESSAWEIDLSGCPVSEEELRLLPRMGNITELYLTDTPVGDTSMESIGRLKSLTLLELGNTSITDAALPNIGDLPQLEVLGLFETSITDAGLCHLQHLDSLWCLDLDHTRVRGRGLSELLPVRKQLEWLFLSHTDVSDAAVPQLCHFVHLEELYLYDTLITSTRLRRIQAALPNCKIKWSPRNLRNVG